MVKIIGPIKIKSGKKLPEEISKHISGVYGIKGSIEGAKKVEAKPVIREEESVDEVEKLKEELESKDYSELKKIGKKYRVKGRSKEGLISDIIGRITGTKEPEM